MKKIYSLLLLGGLLLFGAESAWATSYVLRGSFHLYESNWANIDFAMDGKVGKVYLNLPASSSYNFGVDIDGTWYKNGAYTSSSTSHTLSSTTGSNCSITTTDAGTYTFTLDVSEGVVLTITYPSDITYTFGFTNESSWGTVKAYAFCKDSRNNDAEILGDWPGTDITSSLSSKSFTTKYIPTIIIFNNGSSGSGNQTENLVFVDKAVYDNSGVKSYSVDPTDVTGKNYATFYAPYNAELPTGVTAYKGDLVGFDLSLSAFNSQIIPANTPVVLKASSGASFTIEATTKAAGSASGNNDLTGTNAEIAKTSVDVPEGDALCVLGVTGGVVGFYTYTGTNLAANRAYLIVPAGGGTAPSAIRILDETENATNIQSVEANEGAVKFIQNGQLLVKKNGVVYDMTGRVIR